jgi:hypothetical protein
VDFVSGQAGGPVVRVMEHLAGGGLNPRPTPTPVKVFNEDRATGGPQSKKIKCEFCLG